MPAPKYIAGAREYCRVAGNITLSHFAITMVKMLKMSCPDSFLDLSFHVNNHDQTIIIIIYLFSF